MLKSSLPDLKRFIKEMVHSGGELNDVVRVLEDGKSILTIIIDKNNKKIVKNAVDRRHKRKWNDWLRRQH